MSADHTSPAHCTVMRLRLYDHLAPQECTAVHEQNGRPGRRQARAGHLPLRQPGVDMGVHGHMLRSRRTHGECIPTAGSMVHFMRRHMRTPSRHAEAMAYVVFVLEHCSQG